MVIISSSGPRPFVWLMTEALFSALILDLAKAINLSHPLFNLSLIGFNMDDNFSYLSEALLMLKNKRWHYQI